VTETFTQTDEEIERSLRLDQAFVRAKRGIENITDQLAANGDLELGDLSSLRDCGVSASTSSTGIKGKDRQVDEHVDLGTE
jgi:hypothetical protein